jgi:adhesin HecA-like repeat protein
MVLQFQRIFTIAVCLAAFCLPIRAQNQTTITVRMLDNRTGVLIASSNYLVRINHQKEDHGNWIVRNEDGTGNLTLPAEAELVSIHATYESAMLVYANCDADKDRGSAEHAPSPDRWYPVATILSSGVVAPNNCIGKKVPEKLQVIAKPGEFVFFVRPLTSREKIYQ